MPAGAHQRITSHARAAFLRELSLRGNVTAAAEAAKHPRETFYAHRKRDEQFAAEWDQALEEATERLEREARRRAEEGTDRPIYQRGELVGYERQYSDSLMICLLKAHSPKYREKVEVGGPGGGALRVRWDVPAGEDDGAPS